MRKIGYSVGLEQTRERVGDLCDNYIRAGQLTPSTWSSLVHEQWRLKNDNIGDLFNALGLVKRTKSKIDVLGGLDLCSVARLIDRRCGAERARAYDGALLLLLIENDGEILLNCLAAGFENEATVDLLTNLIHYKRSVLFDIFRAPEVQLTLSRTVGIDRQTTNIGGAGKGSKGLKDAKRSEPLTKRTESLRGAPIPEVEISDDYLRKVIPRRRDWAQSLGLIDVSGVVTEMGTSLLSKIDELGLRLQSGAVILWPFEHEVSRLRMNPTVFEGRIVDYWKLVEIAIVGVGGTLKDTHNNEDIKVLRESATLQISGYRELNRPKAMLRRELPLTIGYYTLASEFMNMGRPVPPISIMIEQIRQEGGMGLEVRSSRNSIGTLAVRSK